MSEAADGSVKTSLEQFFQARLHRRQALQLMGGTAAVATLAACGVAPTPAPTSQIPVRTNLVMLRARVRNLSGRDRDRLRAIAAYINPANRSQVDLQGEYWTLDKPIVYGKPGATFLGHGLDIVVFARGETAEAVQAWASQWPGILEVMSDAVEPVTLPAITEATPGTPTFLVFERLAGEAGLRPVFGQLPSGVTVVSYNVLTSDRNRQVLVVRAPTRQRVQEWVEQWIGLRNSMEILELASLSEQLLRAAKPAAAPLPSLRAQADSGVIFKYDGKFVIGDLRPGTWLYRHQATGRFLAVREGKLTLVAAADAADQWDTFLSAGLGENVSGRYLLQHRGSQLFLAYTKPSEGPPQLKLSLTAETAWSMPLVGSQIVGALDSNGRVSHFLATDTEGSVVLEPQTDWDFQPKRNWEQTTYTPPSELQQMLKSIIHGDALSQPWPEDVWRNDPAKQAEWQAYLDILGKLGGRRPNDPLNNLTVDKLNDALAQVPAEKLSTDAYKYVIAHLKNILSYRDYVKDWFGDGGHLRTLLTDTTLNHVNILNAVRGLAPEVDDGSEIELIVKILLFGITTGLAVAGKHLVAGLIEGIYSLYEAARPEAEDPVRSTLVEVADHIRESFNELITEVERAHYEIIRDWGRLEAFGSRIDDQTLQWPGTSDGTTAEIRAESDRQFEIFVWQQIARTGWEYTGTGWLRKGEYYTYTDTWFKIYRNGPLDFFLTAPGTYMDCYGNVDSGWFHDWAYLRAGKGPGTELADRLFGKLRISRLDVFLGRNGWGIPNSQKIGEPI